jgi:hypothetical protein
MMCVYRLYIMYSNVQFAQSVFLLTSVGGRRRLKLPIWQPWHPPPVVPSCGRRRLKFPNMATLASSSRRSFLWQQRTKNPRWRHDDPRGKLRRCRVTWWCWECPGQWHLSADPSERRQSPSANENLQNNAILGFYNNAMCKWWFRWWDQKKS